MAAQPTWAEVEEAAWLSDESHQHEAYYGSNGGGSGTGPSIPAWQRNDQDVTDFGPVPLGLERDVLVVDCPDCRKPVLQRFLSFHRQNCALVRDIVNGKVSSSVLDGKRRKRAPSIGSNDTATNASMLGAGSVMGDGESGPPRKKTRKEEKLAEAAARRKARLDAKEAKALKKKNRMSRGDPLDVDRQCGVITEKGPCSRSLTCKSHSMGAKRAVPGRSRPYDDLLFEWQKATNPAFVAKLREKERVMAEAAREREQEKARKLEAKKKRLLITKKKAKDGTGEGGGGAGGSSKKKGGKDGTGGAGARDKDGAGADGLDSLGMPGAGTVLDVDADMYVQGASEAEVELEFEAVLEAIRSAAMAPRTMAMPLAVSGRNFGAGAYAHKAMRFRALRAGPPIF
ncbi:SAGA complex subunit Sgf73 [Tilletia horrida]|nr:SAGA complex subunit Sgf73 [Tilletia horrida]